MNYEELMQRARAVNRKRDAGERRNNFAAPGDMPIRDHIQTAMFAIEAGIKTDNWNTIAEGQALLEEVIQRLTG